MLPLDTIKTRLVTQSIHETARYTGILSTGAKIVNEEGLRALYRGLGPRLLAVVPMMGIQLGCYEIFRKIAVH